MGAHKVMIVWNNNARFNQRVKHWCDALNGLPLGGGGLRFTGPVIKLRYDHHMVAVFDKTNIIFVSSPHRCAVCVNHH